MRCFGAEVGRRALIRPTVAITYPWKVVLGDYCWIGDDVVLYSLGGIAVGKHAVVSQRSYVCAADHDYSTHDFRIRARDISIGEGVWVATDVFVGPGVTIEAGAVVGARSSVFRDLPADFICFGSPCKPMFPREIRQQSGSPQAERVVK